jgi:hypothetical protein
VLGVSLSYMACFIRGGDDKWQDSKVKEGRLSGSFVSAK